MSFLTIAAWKRDLDEAWREPTAFDRLRSFDFHFAFLFSFFSFFFLDKVKVHVLGKWRSKIVRVASERAGNSSNCSEGRGRERERAVCATRANNTRVCSASCQFREPACNSPCRMQILCSCPEFLKFYVCMLIGFASLRSAGELRDSVSGKERALELFSLCLSGQRRSLFSLSLFLSLVEPTTAARTRGKQTS